VIIDEDVYLEHYGVRGMKWGVRRDQAASVGKAVGRASKATGRGTVRGAKAVGRGAAATGRFVKENPYLGARVILGATFVAARLVIFGLNHMPARTPLRYPDAINVTFRETANTPVSEIIGSLGR
jgi:hypothetical protein